MIGINEVGLHARRIITSRDGVLDIYPNASAAYSLKLLKVEYTGSAIKVRRSSDDAELDIGFNKVDLDTASLLTFVGAGNGFVTTWYDQSGNNANALQITPGFQPQIVSSGSLIEVNNKPAMHFVGINTHYFTIASRIVELSANDAVVHSISKGDSVGSSTGDGYLLTEGDVISPYSSNFILKGIGTTSAESLWVNTTIFGTTGDLTQEMCGFTKVGGSGIGSREMRAYRNGAVDGPAANAIVNAETSNSVIGAAADLSVSFFNGKVQEIISYKNSTYNLINIQNTANKYWNVY